MTVRRLRLLCVAVVSGLAALAGGVAPAGGGLSATGAPGDCAVLESFSPLIAAGESARGEGGREPVLDEPVKKLGEVSGTPIPGFTATVLVYFHVVTPDGVTGNVSDSQIEQQILVMNLAFSGFYGGPDTGFRFVLAEVTRTTNSEWYEAGPGSHAEREMKKALGEDGPNVLNFYSTTAGPYLGWAYLPGLTRPRQYLDGIVVDWESMVGTSTAYEGRYDLGLTAVHEAGHWLGLEHTFFRGCSAKGDYVEDTPPMKEPTSGCPVGKDTCPNDPGLDPVQNYMDYSYDACYSEFTPGQAARMQAHWNAFRLAA